MRIRELQSPLSRYVASIGKPPFARRPSEPEDQAGDTPMSQSAAYAAWAGFNSFAEKRPASSDNQADRVDAATSRRQPVAPSQDRGDSFRRRWLDTLLDTNMERSGIVRPVKTGPQPIKPVGRGLLDALREALEDKDGYSDPLRGPVAM